MALFTDGSISTVEDLAAHDSQLLEIASTEGIDVAQKLEVAQEETAIDLSALLGKTGPAQRDVWQGAAPNLATVVVTPALRQWHTFRALEITYRDAYNNQLNDRYAGKRDSYRDMAKWAYERLIQLGVGIALKPVPRAATPRLESVPGSLPVGIYYVATGWVNDAGEEGACSRPEVTSSAGNTFRVHAGAPPRGVAGWNVYVGDSAETMTLQNSAPIAPGDSWVQPPSVSSTGRTPSGGQRPSYMQFVGRAIQRG
jgi:hypothetical protein